MGVQAFKYRSEDGLETWIKPLENGDWAVTFLNRADDDRSINFDWKEENIKDPNFDYSTDFSEITYAVRDLWKHKELRSTKRVLKSSIAPHDVLSLRLTKN
jgi:alpha-galactosidase